MATEEVIRVERLTKVYPNSRQPAVDNLTLSVDRGTVFGLLGPNGAGKTTTLSILCTLLKPTSGRVTLLGYDVVAQASLLRRRIGLVPQEIALYPTLTLRENLTYFARILGVTRQRAAQRVSDCLDLVGLGDRAQRRIDTFSGGMKRRANLAVAILHEPDILFLDEPTVGIDAQSRHLIRQRLLELNAAGMTLVYTTHHMEEAQHFCRKIAIIDNGRMIATGVPDELISAAGTCRNLEELFLALTGKQLRDSEG
mgnify:CR=1 FL=1